MDKKRNRNEYMKQYRQKNQDKIAAINLRYWQRRSGRTASDVVPGREVKDNATDNIRKD